MRRIETFGDHHSGLGKFTRTLFARDLRREVETPSLAALDSPGAAADRRPPATPSAETGDGSRTSR